MSAVIYIAMAKAATTNVDVEELELNRIKWWLIPMYGYTADRITCNRSAETLLTLRPIALKLAIDWVQEFAHWSDLDILVVDSL